MSENLADNHERISSASARWYPVTALVTLLLLLAVIPCAMLSLANLAPTNHSSETSRYLFYWGKQKQKIADQAEGRRILLIGGSGTLYSVRAKMLQDQFGIPTINTAMHGGLGIDYLLYRARQTLRSGDTAILFLEYTHYSRREPEWTLADHVLPHDLAYFSTQPPSTQIRLLSKLIPGEYGSRVYDAVFGKPVDGSKILSALNNCGDITKNRRESQKDFQRAALDKSLPLGNSFLQPESADLIADFIRWCQNNGITVIAGYPALMDFPEYHFGAGQALFQSWEAYYHSLGVPALGKPADFMFPKSMFFDTRYHLDNIGAEMMTDLVARRLEPILGVKRSLEGNAPSMQIDHPVRLMLGKPDVPDGIETLTGFSEAEPWGRWTIAEKATVEFSNPLPSHFRLDAKVVHVINDKTRTPILVRVGKEERSVPVTAQNMDITLEFQTDGKTGIIEIIPPEPKSPKQLGLSGDTRLLGLGLSKLEITPLSTGTAAKMTVRP